MKNKIGANVRTDKVSNSERMVRFSVRVPTRFWAKVESAARRHGLRASEMLQVILFRNLQASGVALNAKAFSKRVRVALGV